MKNGDRVFVGFKLGTIDRIEGATAYVLLEEKVMSHFSHGTLSVIPGTKSIQVDLPETPQPDPYPLSEVEPFTEEKLLEKFFKGISFPKEP